MTRINADYFIDCWKEFSNEFTLKNEGWELAYNNDSAWTNLFLGAKKSSSDSSLIGKHFKGKFQNLRYRTEDGSFDLTMSTANNYKNIPYIAKNNISYFDIEEEKYFPTSYDVIVEIENKHERAWYEMTKLTWVRSPLKVLVTYHNKQDVENKALVESFKTIISQSSFQFKDNPETEYLLIIGDNKEKFLIWEFYKFDNEGQPK